VDRRSDNATSVDVEIDPHCRRLGRSQTDFALQAIVECRAAEAKGVAVLIARNFARLKPKKKKSRAPCE
jgi:hypothetical protein